MDTERFDISGKAEGNASADELRLMIQNLLAERFKLVVHAEKRELPIYSLILARSDGELGPRLRRAQFDCAGPEPGGTISGATAQATGRPICGLRLNPGRGTDAGITLGPLAPSL
jgi:uncharacterized protein (TIGR03435 family)